MRKLKLLFFVILGLAFTANAQENVYIGLHTKKNVRNLEVGVKKGTYQVWANGEPVMDLHPGAVIDIEAKRNSVKMVTEDTIIRRNFIIRFNSMADDNMFTIRLNGVDTTLYRYDGDLLITASYHRLKLINIVDIQSYLAGVVKAEIGHLKEPEFLKAMSTVARTYVLKNKYRHEKHGFDLCDRTHCQVYLGVLNLSDAIIRSVESTKNKVIVDGKHRLVKEIIQLSLLCFIQLLVWQNAYAMLGQLGQHQLIKTAVLRHDQFACALRNRVQLVDNTHTVGTAILRNTRTECLLAQAGDPYHEKLIQIRAENR